MPRTQGKNVKVRRRRESICELHLRQEKIETSPNGSTENGSSDQYSSNENPAPADKARRHKESFTIAPLGPKHHIDTKKSAEQLQKGRQSEDGSIYPKNTQLSASQAPRTFAPPLISQGNSLTSLETASTFMENSSLGSSSSLSYPQGKRNYRFIKPPYILNRSKFISSAEISKDSLASSAFDMIAYKLDKTNDSTQNREWFARHQQASYIMGPHRGRRSASEGRQETNNKFDRRVDTGAVKLKTNLRRAIKLDVDRGRYRVPLSKEIERFVENSPETYDTQIAPMTWGSSVTRSHLSEKPISNFKITSFKGQGGDGPHLPVLKTVPSAQVRRDTSGDQFLMTSTMVLPDQKSVFIKPTRVTHRPVPSKDATAKVELSGPHPDMNVRISYSQGNQEDIDSHKYPFSNYSVVIEPISHRYKTRDERKLLRAGLDDIRKMSKTAETSHIASIDVISQTRLPFKEECRSAFKSQRIPTLRRSPAVIICPVPTTCETSPLSSAPSSTTLKSSVCTETGSFTSDRMRSKIGSRHYDILLKTPQEQVQRLSQLYCMKKGCFGSIRVDQLGIGAPRFYHWAPFNENLIQEVRCRVRQTALLLLLNSRNPKKLPFIVPEADRDGTETQDFEKEEEVEAKLYLETKNKKRTPQKCKKQTANSVVLLRKTKPMRNR